MIAAKAKNGLTAVTKGETKSVSEALKQTGTLIMMIAVASGLNIYTSMGDINATGASTTLEANASQVIGKMLQSGHKVSDKVQGTHFNGGVAANAMEEFSKMPAESFKKGAKKVAKTAVAVESFNHKNFVEEPVVKKASINMVIEALEAKKTVSAKKVSPAPKKLNAARSHQQYKEVSAYLLFVLTTGISIAYYVSFKTYSTHLNKLDSLKKMLKNPNARVAAGKTGKSIMQRIKAEQTTTEAPKKIHASKNANATVSMLKELIEARKVQKQTKAVEYSAPLLEVEEPVQRFEAPKVDNISMEQIKKALADRMIANQVAQAQVQVQQPVYSMPPVGTMPVM